MVRWALLGVVAAIVGALVAAGVTQAAAPAHAVPSVMNLDQSAAQAILVRYHFRVQVRSAFDEQATSRRVLQESPPPGTRLKEHRTVTLVVSKGAPPRAVPSLSRMGSDAASAAVQAAGFNPKVQGTYSEDVAAGTVLDWSPRDGLQPKGSDVTITVSNGPRPRTVPDVSGQTFDAASSQLQAAGLNVQRRDDFSDTVQPGAVIGTSPPAGASVARDSTVTVSVSKGPDLVGVPDARGRSVDEATTLLNQAGLTVANVYGPSKHGTVFFTDPAAGKRVHRGSGINLYTL